jgi:hypothetical protein
MSGRSRAELDQIRVANRAKLGLAGLGQIPSLGGVVRSVRLATSFPEVEYEFLPGATEPAAAEGSGVAAWLTAHVTRPRAIVGTIGGDVELDPWRDDADYSWIARVLAVLGSLALAGGTAWVLSRALLPARRKNYDPIAAMLRGGRW